MLFSSVSFLLLFLPVVLILYFVLFKVLGRTASNLLLLVASLFFYGWGEPYYILILLLSILFNYGMAVCMEATIKYRKVCLCFSIAVNLFILFIFKYLNFVLDNLMKLGWKINILDTIQGIAMPIGISFYTFQALSYVVDVYRGEVKAKRNPLDVGLYISFFPQLIAGPIVRYYTIAEQIKNRTETWDKIGEGISRFVMGLSKKVILSNSFALIADECFENLGVGGVLSVAWIGILSYTLQIYYDFSGYSDMAIGLGKIFGFEFLENFNYPYYAESISDFWRRWHISLGSFFREYVYIPLGGSKVGRKRLIRNLFIVWLLTGLWHGANWTFVLWGIMYYVLIAIEKLWAGRKKSYKMMGHLYTIFWVMIGWVLFRSNSVGDAIRYIGIMLGIGAEKISDVRSGVLLQENRVLFLIGVIGCFPVIPYIKRHWSKYEAVLEIIKTLAVPLLFFVCCCYLVKSTYNPFIYFNF
jgi:alginate O-acetyltransferase complex protein AlgI